MVGYYCYVRAALSAVVLVFVAAAVVLLLGLDGDGDNDVGRVCFSAKL